MVWDLFMFNNEIDLLKRRIEYLSNVVDRFVIVEATRTHSNKQKKLVFKNNLNNFEKYADKIVHLIFDGPYSQNAWENENNQRNHLLSSLDDFSKGDILICGDLDEIPNIKIFNRIVKSYPSSKYEIFTPIMACYNYNSELLNPKLWKSQRIIYADFFLDGHYLDHNSTFNKYLIEEINVDFTLTKLRFYNKLKLIKFGGWHLSYFGNTEFIFDKLKAFSHHDEYNLNGLKIEKLIQSNRFLDSKKLIRINKDYFKLNDFYPQAEYKKPFAIDFIYIKYQLQTWVLILLWNSKINVFLSKLLHILK